jgi:adenylate kinase
LKRRIVLLGPPASGKGTQAEMLSEKYGIPTVSTGALLREERARGTELGREVDAWTSRGLFFPDEIALAVVRQWLDDHGYDEFLLDGFPRTLGQAQAFDRELAEAGGGIDEVFHFSVSDDEIRARVASRITCTHCGASFSTRLHDVREGDHCPSCGETLVRRRDDTSETLSERLSQHREHTSPVVEYYRASGRLTEIDATADRAEIFRQLCEHLEEVAA